MSYRRILANIDELRKLVEGWREGKKPAEIEMDMALDRVKSIYEQLRFPTEECVDEPVNEEVAAAEEVAEPARVEEIAKEETPTTVVAITEDVTTPEPASEPEPEPEPEPIDQLKEAKLKRRKLILALYDDAPKPAPEPEVIEPEEIEPEITESEEIAEPEPEVIEPETTETEEITEPEPEVIETEEIAEPEPEVIEPETTETEEIAEPEPEVIEPEAIEPETTETEETTEPEPTESALLSLLGINDKILLAEDLTNGDIETLERAIRAIEAQQTFDDAMIYIAENYSWSGDSDGAKLLITLLQTHYL